METNSDGHTGDSFTVKCTNANVSIQDLRGEDKVGIYKVINTKPPINEQELLEQIKKLVRENENDQELGAACRKLLT